MVLVIHERAHMLYVTRTKGENAVGGGVPAMDMYLLVVLQLFMPIPKDLLVLKDLVRRFGVHFFADLIDCLAAILLARLDKLGKVTAVPCLKPGLEELVLLGNLLLTQWHCCCDFLLLNLAVCFVFVCPHFLTLVLWHLTRAEKKTTRRPQVNVRPKRSQGCDARCAYARCPRDA